VGRKSGHVFSLIKELRESLLVRQRERVETRKIIPFKEYLGSIESGEEKYFATVHERLSCTIVEKGVRYITLENDPATARMYGITEGSALPIYAAFDQFVGIADVIDDLVSYFHAPVMLPGTSEEELQALVMIGPTGAGKSRLADRLIKLLEQSGPLWRLYGCPHNDHPLSLLPQHLRPLSDDAAEELACKRLNESAVKIRRLLKKLDIRIEQDLCPICRERLLKGWPDARLPDGSNLSWLNGGFLGGSTAIEDYPVERVEFSKRSNTGYFEVPLTDEDDFDVSPLIGKIDMAKIPLYKSESAIGVLTLDGAFNRANQGILEFPELFKRPRRPLKILIGATQDKLTPLPGSHGNVSVNLVIIGHSNWEEYEKFRAKGSRNEALMRRFAIKFVRYNLHLSEEVGLLESRINVKRRKELFDIAPHTVEVVAGLTVLSRYKPVPEISLLQKLDVLDGKIVADSKGRVLSAADVKHERDGLEEAISFREEMKLFGRLFHKKRIQSRSLEYQGGAQKIPIIPADALELLPQMIEGTSSNQSFSTDWKQTMLGHIEIVRERYHNALLQEFRNILISDLGERTNELFLRYIQNCGEWVVKNTDSKKKQQLDPDEKSLDLIEKKVHGGVRNVKEFRRSLMELYWAEEARTGKVTYRDLGEQFAKALEEYAFYEFTRWLRIISSADAMSDADRLEYERVIRALQPLGYTELTAPKVLDYFVVCVVRAA
jgi:serine protein kinase